MHDFLWENSWTYRQSVERGREESIREDIEAAVKTRFPALVELARERSANLQGEEALRKVLIAMIAAPTEKKARRYLLALNG